MTIPFRLTLLFAAVLVLLATACLATDEDIRLLEQEISLIRSDVNQLTIQQQSIGVDVTQRLSDLDERVNAVDQRLTELEADTSELSESDNDIQARMFEIESRLDERAIYRVLRMPLTYVVVIPAFILVPLISLLIGFRIHNRKYHQAQPSPELEE